VEREILGRHMGASARLAIYRNNVVLNLTGALRLTFPAINRLVGAAFFDQAAGHFILASPPWSADLYEFGEGFAAFLDRYGPAQGFRYLGDVARLEWAVSRALHAADAAWLDGADLAACADPDIRFLPHPSLSLLQLDHPAAAIWSAVLEEDSKKREQSLRQIDLQAGAETLAIVRGPNGLAVTRLSPSSFTLAHALAGGTGLSSALQNIVPEEAPGILAAFVSHGFFTRFRPHLSNKG